MNWFASQWSRKYAPNSVVLVRPGTQLRASDEMAGGEKQTNNCLKLKRKIDQYKDTPSAKSTPMCVFLSCNPPLGCSRQPALNVASFDDKFVLNDGGRHMRTTLALDDELIAKAEAFTGLKEKSSLVREALKALIERESARRLARLGGSQPGLKAPTRRRPSAA